MFESTDITKTSGAYIRPHPLFHLPSPFPPPPRSTGGCPSPTCPDILAQVASGAKTDTIPPDLTPSLADAVADLRVPDGGQCTQLPISWLKPDRKPCIFDTGAPANAPTIVLIGDFPAVMWSRTVLSIAKQLGYGFGLVSYSAVTCR